jgi:hypothetical protein
MESYQMKAKHWLLTGAGCIASSILLGVLTMLFWMNQINSAWNKRDPFGTDDPSQGFGIVIAASAFINLLFLGGIIVLIVGFIKLAKEPKSGSGSESDKKV